VARFHDKSFDDATQLKLELFRGYIREWLPVFLTPYGDGRRNYRAVNILDFFSGPGYDVDGNPGSPVIIVEELKQYCQTRPDLKAGVDVRMLFNDVEAANIDKLKQAIQPIACPQSCCQIQYTVQPFQAALQQHLPEIGAEDSANLVIMDQFGVKEVTPDVVRQLAECSATDILFFISSSIIGRFIGTPELGGKFDMEADDVRSVEYKGIHRLVCQYYRQKLVGLEYYLAPFSIKKGSNIYGVIFGSGRLLGSQKFLNVCWKEDSVTGEANYNIDGDFAWARRSLFQNLNIIRKVDLFEGELRRVVAEEAPDNRKIYRFCLTHGFRPGQAGEVLRRMQKDGLLSVVEIATGQPARRGAFYLTWAGYSKSPARVRFTMRSEQ